MKIYLLFSVAFLASKVIIFEYFSRLAGPILNVCVHLFVLIRFDKSVIYG